MTETIKVDPILSTVKSPSPLLITRENARKVNKMRRQYCTTNHFIEIKPHRDRRTVDISGTRFARLDWITPNLMSQVPHHSKSIKNQ